MYWLSGLLWLQDRNREFNGWFADSPTEYYIDGAENEITEIRESLAKKDHDELELEVGDLLWDTLSLINKLDHAWLIDRDRVCSRAVAKFSERMPYNVLGYFEWDHEIRENIWNTVKKLQKTRGLDENHELVRKVWENIKKEEIIKNKE